MIGIAAGLLVAVACAWGATMIAARFRFPWILAFLNLLLLCLLVILAIGDYKGYL